MDILFIYLYKSFPFFLSVVWAFFLRVFSVYHKSPVYDEAASLSLLHASHRFDKRLQAFLWIWKVCFASAHMTKGADKGECQLTASRTDSAASYCSVKWWGHGVNWCRVSTSRDYIASDIWLQSGMNQGCPNFLHFFLTIVIGVGCRLVDTTVNPGAFLHTWFLWGH